MIGAVTYSPRYGEILHINLVKQPDSNLSRGFAFLGYEDQRSTVLAVDNLNGVELVGKVLRVNHAKDYSPRDKDGESTLYNAAPDTDRLSSGSSASHHIRPYSNERSHVKDDPHRKNSREASASFRSDTLTVRERQTESYTSRRYSSRNHSRERSRSPSPRMDRDQTRYYRSRTNRPRSSATRSRDQQPEQSRARSTSGEAARERQLKTLR